MVLPQDRTFLRQQLRLIECITRDAADQLRRETIDDDLLIEELSDDLNVVVEHIQRLNERILSLRTK